MTMKNGVRILTTRYVTCPKKQKGCILCLQTDSKSSLSCEHSPLCSHISCTQKLGYIPFKTHGVLLGYDIVLYSVGWVPAFRLPILLPSSEL